MILTHFINIDGRREACRKKKAACCASAGEQRPRGGAMPHRLERSAERAAFLSSPLWRQTFRARLRTVCQRRQQNSRSRGHRGGRRHARLHGQDGEKSFQKRNGKGSTRCQSLQNDSRVRVQDQGSVAAPCFVVVEALYKSGEPASERQASRQTGDRIDRCLSTKAVKESRGRRENGAGPLLHGDKLHGWIRNIAGMSSASALRKQRHESYHFAIRIRPDVTAGLPDYDTLWKCISRQVLQSDHDKFIGACRVCVGRRSIRRQLFLCQTSFF